MLDMKVSTLIDKVDTWMKIVSQNRLDDYKLSKNIEKLMNTVESLSAKINIEPKKDIPKTSDDLSFLNNLLREYPEVSYRIENGLATIKLKKNIEPNRFCLNGLSLYSKY